MPVPTDELKLHIVNAATGKCLAAPADPGEGGALVVRDFPSAGPNPQQWQLLPAQDDHAYVIRNADSGQVLDDPATEDRGIR
ncbi:RICIN domain-containing protein [Streptomyces griseofuscus]